MRPSTRARSRLAREDIDAVTGILEGWQGKLTWEALVDRVAAVLGRTYTRQGLERHEQIKRAFQIRKARLRAAGDAASARRRKDTGGDLPPELVAERQRRQALEERVARLERTISAYDERFAVWLHNSRLAGLTQERLNAPLPPVLRGRSDGQ